MDSRSFPGSATVVAAGDVLASDFGSESVLLNLKNGTYYGLQEVGCEIWKMIQIPVSIGDLCAALVDMFEVDSDRCRRDVLSLMADLLANGLIEIRDPTP